MKRVPGEFRGAVTGFVVLLSKGLLDDNRWDWDVERSNAGPSSTKKDARFRGFQYVRQWSIHRIPSTRCRRRLGPRNLTNLTGAFGKREQQRKEEPAARTATASPVIWAEPITCRRDR
jgi:hypothetical protein